MDVYLDMDAGQNEPVNPRPIKKLAMTAVVTAYGMAASAVGAYAYADRLSERFSRLQSIAGKAVRTVQKVRDGVRIANARVTGRIGKYSRALRDPGPLRPGRFKMVDYSSRNLFRAYC